MPLPSAATVWWPCRDSMHSGPMPRDSKMGKRSPLRYMGAWLDVKLCTAYCVIVTLISISATEVIYTELYWQISGHLSFSKTMEKNKQNKADWLACWCKWPLTGVEEKQQSSNKLLAMLLLAASFLFLSSSFALYRRRLDTA